MRIKSRQCYSIISSLCSHILQQICTTKFYFQKCAEFKGDNFLCEDVVILSALKIDSPTNWTFVVTSQQATFVDRVWNDPEFNQTYDMYEKVAKSISDHSDWTKSYHTIYGKLSIRSNIRFCFLSNSRRVCASN